MPSLVLGVIVNVINAKYNQDTAQQFFLDCMTYYILIYIPLIGIIRLKSLNFSLNEILFSLIPIFGIYYRKRRLFYSKKDN
ncbi:hypothetical protein GCM10028810_11690 [Spirosoma litoris]